MNHLYYGDNLGWLRDEAHFPDESVDLIYLDPPFNSNATYNQLFSTPKGKPSVAQIEAFEDTWHWGESAEAAFRSVRTEGSLDVSTMLTAMRKFLGENDMMAYLSMMAVRLIELHRVLKPTGSLYLHCDPTASHYLKILLDAVFGPEQFLNEITWRRYRRPKGSQHKSRRYGRSSDIVLFYSKTGNHQFNADAIRTPLSDDEITARYTQEDAHGPFMSGPLLRGDSMGPRPNLVFEFEGFTPGPAGWRMTKAKLKALKEAGDIHWTSGGQPRRKVRPKDDPGNGVDNIWTDIDAIESQAPERLGYPTQKPVALLERIISASSKEGDTVLDPFCGCGTTVHAAQKLNRRWIGIDVTHLAIGLIEKRLRDAYRDRPKDLQFKTFGVPADIEGARDLARRGRKEGRHYFEFEKWAVSLLAGKPTKNTGDGGIDGIVEFGKSSMAVISVKAGENVGVGMIRDLRGAMERLDAEIGVFLTLTPPNKGMIAEAAAAGYHKEEGFEPVPRLQIVTVEEAMHLKERSVQLPARRDDTRKAAPKEVDRSAQGSLL